MFSFNHSKGIPPKILYLKCKTFVLLLYILTKFMGIVGGIMRSKSLSDKTILVGSYSSLILAILGIIFSFTQIRGVTLGSLLNFKIPASIISIVLFVFSIIIGIRFNKNKIAKIGMCLSIVFSLIIITLLIFNLVM